MVAPSEGCSLNPHYVRRFCHNFSPSSNKLLAYGRSTHLSIKHHRQLAFITVRQIYVNVYSNTFVRFRICVWFPTESGWQFIEPSPFVWQAWGGRRVGGNLFTFLKIKVCSLYIFVYFIYFYTFVYISWQTGRGRRKGKMLFVFFQNKNFSALCGSNQILCHISCNFCRRCPFLAKYTYILPEKQIIFTARPSEWTYVMTGK